MKRIFAVILVLVMALSLCACGETEPSVGDQMYEKYGALIDKLEAGDFYAAADSFFSMMPNGEKYSSVVEKLRAEDYDGIIAEVTEMMPVPPETVVEITPENFWEYYELAYSEPNTTKDAQGNIIKIDMIGDMIGGLPKFTLKEEYANRIDLDRSSLEVGYAGDWKCRKVESIDWSTGEYTLGNEYYDDIAQNIQSYMYANVHTYINGAYEPLKLNFSTSSFVDTNSYTYNDAKTLLLPTANNNPYGAWYKDLSGGWGQYPEVTPDSSFDIYFFTLENVEIVRAEGTLVILNG